MAVVVIGEVATLAFLGGLSAGAGTEAGKLLLRPRGPLLTGAVPLGAAAAGYLIGLWAVPLAFVAWWLVGSQPRPGWVRAAVLAALVGGGAAALGSLLAADRWLEWLAVLAVATFGGESAAWLMGSKLGRRRMAPRLSPRKTWEGAAAQALFGLATGLVAAIWLPSIEAIVLGLTGGVVGQVGDLAASWCKRKAGVVDSGRTFGAQGGFLDLIDGFLGAALAVAALTPILTL